MRIFLVFLTKYMYICEIYLVPLHIGSKEKTPKVKSINSKNMKAMKKVFNSPTKTLLRLCELVSKKVSDDFVIGVFSVVAIIIVFWKW